MTATQPDTRRPRILVCDTIATAGIERLRQHADVDIRTDLSASVLSAIISDYEGLLVAGKTQVTGEVIAHGQFLKVIGRAGAGLDNIDVKTAQEYEIPVVNSPSPLSVAIAEHTMALLLAAARRLPLADLSVKSGNWDQQSLVGTGLAGKTLGIIGFGRIGREVARRALAFDMKILVNQRRPTPELEMEAGVRAVDLHDLLQASDFVSLHVPHRDETHHMLGAAELAMMRPDAHLINTARGSIIDENALLAALNEGLIGGAALDVFEDASNQVLARHPRVIATPRIAARTIDVQKAAAISVTEQMIDILQDISVDNVLPLRVVPMDKVLPHESIDPHRVARLAARLAEEGRLVNPPVVTQVDDKYMVLDGATRTAALKKLNYPHAIVQVINSEDGLGLRTWYHVVRQLEPGRLRQIIEDLPSINLVETELDLADDALFEYGALCYVLTVDQRAFLVQAETGVNRLEALNHVTEAYIAAGRVERTLDKDLINLQYEYPDMAGLIVFPEYTVSQVMQVTLSGRYFPAGITRFIIPGRILRLNAELAELKSDKPLREKNRWLNDMLLAKQNRGKIRYYAEPVYLMDE